MKEENASAPVDVLAVGSLRELAGDYRARGLAETADDIEVQAAAVAELIAAAKFLRARIIATNGADCVDRLDAALARVGGEK